LIQNTSGMSQSGIRERGKRIGTNACTRVAVKQTHGQVRQIYQGERGRGRGTRLSIRLGMEKRAYMDRGHSVEEIHKNTRGIDRPD